MANDLVAAPSVSIDFHFSALQADSLGGSLTDIKFLSVARAFDLLCTLRPCITRDQTNKTISFPAECSESKAKKRAAQWRLLQAKPYEFLTSLNVFDRRHSKAHVVRIFQQHISLFRMIASVAFRFWIKGKPWTYGVFGAIFWNANSVFHDRM